MNKTTMDNLSDQLQSKVFQYLVDLADFRNCRLVSHKWKRTVMEACQSKFHMVFPLTDSTLHNVSKLKDTQVSFDIYALTGKQNKDTWRRSGIEHLMQTAEWLQFNGNEVKTSDIQKILGLAHSSLKTLSFKCVKTNLVNSLLEMQVPFSALRKLSIGYYIFDPNQATKENIFSAFTNTLEKWSSLDCRVQLPLLESLSLYLDCRSEYNPHPTINLMKDRFQNYLAIAKLLLKYKQTLREVQVENIIPYLYASPPLSLQSEWTEMERGLEALDELNLNRLKLSTKRSTLRSFPHPTHELVGTEILGRPKNLRNVLFNYLTCPNFGWDTLIAPLKSFNNLCGCYLTSIKIILPINHSPDPTMTINLGGLKECKNLKVLCLNVNCRNAPGKLFVRNMELLPKGISTLHFECSHNQFYLIGEEILVDRQQIRWIIDNLKELESFRLSFVIPEQTNQNENNEQRGAGAQNNNLEVNANPQPQQEEEEEEEEEINRMANISLDLFRDLIALPKLNDFKVNMMRARAFNIVADPFHNMFGVRQQHCTTIRTIQEYSDLCKAARYKTTVTTSNLTFFRFLPVPQICKYVTLTCQRDQN